ncbi:F0F1 ATP synthase subunit B [Acetivibrio cellulolyticus]|uniref:F0F1 ATP synthase subunit B n=1 Tax=Acetivibrio cellulolyticus TaxID=35830 RepID=UPI0001E2CC1C|nr:F0F1 ATP synthase subunit B [Acetivibrio cellulolyticus]
MDLLFGVPDFIWAIINLLVLYLILKKFLFKPITEFMENRANLIKEQLEGSQKSNEEAADLKLAYERKLETAHADASKIINDAKLDAQDKYDEIIKKAKADAEVLREKAEAEIERERNEMIKAMRNEIVSLALEAASKVMEANMNTEANKKLVDEVVTKKGIA